MKTASAIRVGVSAAIIRDGRVLLIEYDTSGVDDSGVHLNFPGGGVELGETLSEAVQREAWEEANVRVIVGPLLHVFEYVPARCGGRYGPQQKLGLLFRCDLAPGSEPRMPETPDTYQTAVRWIPLGDLAQAPLLPRPTGALLQALRSPFSPPILCEEV